MSYEDDIKREQEEADAWWRENGDKVDPVIEDEIDGEEVVSYEAMVEAEEEAAEAEDEDND